MVRPHTITPITKEEMVRLIEEVEKADEFDYMIYMVLKTTGRRIGELYGIEEVKVIGRRIVGKRIIYIEGKPVEIDKTVTRHKRTGDWLFGVRLKDIDFDSGTMKVWVLKRKKHIQDETILLPEVVRIIKSYVRKNHLTLDNYVFRRKGRSLRQIQHKMKSYAKKAKIDHHVSIHSFRHYFITELKRKGWPNDKIMKLTGHKSAGTLSIYDHVIAQDIREEALEDLKSL